MTPLKLFAVYIGREQFLVAAEDEAGARAVAQAWRDEQGIAPSSFIRVAPAYEGRTVYAEKSW